MERLAFVIGIGLVLASCASAASTSTEPSCPAPADAREHPRTDAFDAELHAVVSRLRLPGAVLAVRDAEGLYIGAAGMADLAAGVPMQGCHRTRIASVTKSFVAVVVLRLAERGVLSLGDRLDTWLSETTLRGLPNRDSVVVRDLLANRSGIPDYVDMSLVLEVLDDPSRFWTASQALDRVRGRSPEFAAGERFSYSNTNWLLLEQIVEAATGRRFADVLADEVLSPLGLGRTSYERDAVPSGGIVRGYFDVYGNGVVIDTTENLAVGTVAADGGIITDALGVVRFYDALLAQRTLITEASLTAMTRWSDTAVDPSWVVGNFDGYGLGLIRWDVEGLEGVGHGGDLFGYQAHAYHFGARDTTFVLLVNGSSFASAGDNLTARIDEARDALLAAVLER